MAAAAVYQAVVPLVVARDSTGRDVYVYATQIVPEHVTAAEIKRLLAGKFIEKVASAEPTDPSA